MRISELAGKEVVDLSRGARLGSLRDADLILALPQGRIEALVLPTRRGLWQRGELVVPWERVVTVGRDVIVVDLSDPWPAGSTAPAGIGQQEGGRLGSGWFTRHAGKGSQERGNGHRGVS